MKKIEGLFPALVTPYDGEGRVNTDAIGKLVEKLQKSGISGFYVGGSTGESYLLSMQERKCVLEAVKEAADPSMKVIANIGMLATEQSITLAKHAEKVGVTAISSVPPFYFSFTAEELYHYYEDLAGAVDVPVLIYNIPAMSGVKFSTADLCRLLEDKRICGLKHTSFDLFQMQRLIQLYPEKSIFIGHDELFLSAWAVGARAGIGSTYNIMPEKFIGIAQAFARDDQAEALRLQGEVNEMVEVLCEVGVFKGIKEILKMQGMDCGDCRKPFTMPDEAQRAKLAGTAQRLGLLK